MGVIAGIVQARQDAAPERGIEVEAESEIEIRIVLLRDGIDEARDHVTRQALPLVPVGAKEILLTAFLADQHVGAGDVRAAGEIEANERDLAGARGRDAATAQLAVQVARQGRPGAPVLKPCATNWRRVTGRG
jgi:hypothetical protein